MALKDEIKGYIVSKGYNVKSLNEAINKKNGTNFSYQNLTNKINKNSLKYTEILEIAEVLGYEIKWINKDK